MQSGENKKILAQFKEKMVFVGALLSGMKQWEVSLTFQPAHILPFGSVQNSCCNRLEVIKDLVWKMCGHFLHTVHLNVFFSRTSQRYNPANFFAELSKLYFLKGKNQN